MEGHTHPHGGIAMTHLTTLRSKREVDEAIRNTDDLLLVLRFGRADDPTCARLDHTVPTPVPSTSSCRLHHPHQR